MKKKMAIPFMQPTEEDQELSNQQLQIMMALYMALQQVLRSRSFRHSSRNHPRRQGNTVGSREHGLVLLDQDIARLPLPDLVSSAMQQLPPPSPQVTVSAPTSPTRDATFQFPECSGTNNVAAAAAAAAAASYANVARNDNYENEDEEGAPVPTPRPRPRRRRPINVRVPLKKTSLTLEPTCNGDSTCCEHPGHALRNGQWWISIGANLRNIADDFQASKTKILPLRVTERRTGELTTVVGDFRFPEQHKRQQPIHRRYFAFHDPSVYKRDDVMGDSGSLPRLEACLSSTINP
ncbi:uncharacterized protein LOC122632196 isoform X4 [Vespula pensylvanica]|uniref:uncharacterized protein LOC122632196 isoform X4 n=1 Tax=Vespula pensylvanica TaxID=30213 RepID=UPI001CBA4BD3|nr:uncharacterized protein LOC122632196 isoform X4 [Vespula pensylvanica]XP_043674672.1 uncharacterized protein LOC122632196 isoform X4 [Vespula pensylvanica]